MEVRSVARWSVKLAVVGALALACGFIEHDAWSAPRPHATSHAVAKGTYVVRSGDGWFQIALRNHVTMEKLLAANHATIATKLGVGQVIKLPPSGAQPKSAQPKTARAKPPVKAPARSAK